VEAIEVRSHRLSTDLVPLRLRKERLLGVRNLACLPHAPLMELHRLTLELRLDRLDLRVDTIIVLELPHCALNRRGLVDRGLDVSRRVVEGGAPLVDRLLVDERAHVGEHPAVLLEHVGLAREEPVPFGSHAISLTMLKICRWSIAPARRASMTSPQSLITRPRLSLRSRTLCSTPCVRSSALSASAASSSASSAGNRAIPTSIFAIARSGTSTLNAGLSSRRSFATSLIFFSTPALSSSVSFRTRARVSSALPASPDTSRARARNAARVARARPGWSRAERCATRRAAVVPTASRKSGDAATSSSKQGASASAASSARFTRRRCAIRLNAPRARAISGVTSAASTSRSASAAPGDGAAGSGAPRKTLSGGARARSRAGAGRSAAA